MHQVITASEQLDKQLAAFQPLAGASRPPGGWVRAIRETLGMTTRQLADRMGISQPTLVRLEKSEAAGTITLSSLERAAQALGCRVVYALVPHKPLAETIENRAFALAEAQLAAVEQTMRLEAQGVSDPKQRKQARRQLAQDLLRRPARLWDER
jgi:predicted DNA-binding mobile mystery protein A